MSKQHFLQQIISIFSVFLFHLTSCDYWILLGARFIGGIAIGMQHLLITIYINDIVCAHQKQLCFSILQLQFVSGVVFQYILSKLTIYNNAK